MKKLYKPFLVLLLLLLIAVPVFASDDVPYENKEITAFEYNGLINVKERTLNSLLQEFLGERFSDEVYQIISDTLYSQEWMSWFTCEAIIDEYDNLILSFDIHENPYISEIQINGNDKIRIRTIEDALSVQSGDFFQPSDLLTNSEIIKNLYLEKGYRDVVVDSQYTENEELNQMTLIFNINEGMQYKIRNIVFDGIKGVTAKELKKLLTTKAKSFFNSGNFEDTNIEQDKSAILTYYATKGYPDADITDVILEDTGEVNEDITYLNVTFVIDEGEMWRLGNLSVKGNTVFTPDQIEACITVKPGESFNIEKISTTLQNISSLYFDNGFIRALIMPNEIRDEENHTISYDINITEGEQSIIEEIVITGLTKTKPYVFERELSMKVGDVFSRADYIKSQQNLMNTGLLKGIRADLYPAQTSNGVIVEFIVEEGNQMELQFGATFGGNVDGFPVSGFLQWSDKNLAGTGRALSVSTTLSPTTQNVSLGLSDGWVKDKRWSNGVSITVERAVRSGQLQKNPASDYYDGRDNDEETFPLGYDNPYSWYSQKVYPAERYLMDYDYWRIALGYNTGYTFVWNPGSLALSGGVSIGLNHAVYDKNNYDPYELLIQRYNEKWQFSNRLSLSLSWDGRDLKENTTRGYIVSLSYTYAGGILFGLSNYNRLGLNAAAYHSLYSYTNDEGQKKGLVLSVSSQVNFMLPQYWNNTEKGGWGWYEPQLGATQYEMLYIDGMNIGRGSPIVNDLSFLWHNQIELTFPLVYQVVALEGFISATGVTKYLSQLDNFNNIDWYFGAGFGIKMQIPGFPLGLYIVKNATLLNDNGERLWKWQDGPILGFENRPGSGMSLVLAITTSLY